MLYCKSEGEPLIDCDIEFDSEEAAINWLKENCEYAYLTRDYECWNYVKCENCGEWVLLEDFTNTCDCGAEYNGFGQRLAPRNLWGWETGETF